MEVIKATGRRIPDDIVGYAVEPFGSYTTEKITTVKQSAYEMGKLGMKIVLHQIVTREKGEPEIPNKALIDRQKTKQEASIQYQCCANVCLEILRDKNYVYLTIQFRCNT